VIERNLSTDRVDAVYCALKLNVQGVAKVDSTIEKTRRLFELIGNIYDDPLVHAPVAGGLEELAEFVGGWAAAIYCQRVQLPAPVYHQSARIRIISNSTSRNMPQAGFRPAGLSADPGGNCPRRRISLILRIRGNAFYRRVGQAADLADFCRRRYKSADSVALSACFA